MKRAAAVESWGRPENFEILFDETGIVPDLDFLAIDIERPPACKLTESIDTTTSTGRALFGMCGVFGQLETGFVIWERNLAGVAAARRLIFAHQGTSSMTNPERIRLLLEARGSICC